MATSPSPFFFPTTVFPPPPSGFGAPAPDFFPAPSPFSPDFHRATTYHHPYSSPAPAFGSSTALAFGSSAFPSATASYPIWPPPPPNWPIWPPPPPAPDPTTSTAPSTSSTSTYGCVQFSPPPPAETPATSFPTPACGSPTVPTTSWPPTFFTTASQMQPKLVPPLELHDPNLFGAPARFPHPLPESTAPAVNSPVLTERESVLGAPNTQPASEFTAVLKPQKANTTPAYASDTTAVFPNTPLPSGSSIPMPQLLDSIPTTLSRERCNSQRRPSSQADPSYSKAACVPVANQPPHARTATPTSKNSTRRSPVTSPPSPRREASILLELPKADSSILTEMEPVLTAPTTTRQWVVSAPTSSTSTSPISFIGSTPSSGITTMSTTSSRSCEYVASQVLDEMPQSYGFDNLASQSVFLPDGTQRSYYALPENYSLERATSSTFPGMSKSAVSDNYQSFAAPINNLLPEKQTHPSQETQSTLDILAQVKDEVEAISEKLKYESLGHSCEMILDCTEKKATPKHPLTRGTINEFNDMPVYDVYEEDVTACRSNLHPTVEIIEVDTEEVENKVDSGKPIISPERPTDGIFSFTYEKKSATELLAVCFNNNSNNAFSEEATDLAFSHAHVIHGDRSINLTNEKSTQAASILCVHEGNVHHHDKRPEINIQKQDMLINKSGTYPLHHPCNLNNDKEELLWDLGSVRSKTKCSISGLKFRIHEAYPILPCTWDPGIDMFSYNKLHLFPWIPHPAIIILQQLHNKNISSMRQLSLEKGRKLQWDPGIELLLYDLLWLKTLSKGTEYALRYLLARKFGTPNSTCFIDTAAIMCCSLPKLIQQRRNVAAVLYSWRSIFHDMHYRQIFQKCKAMSSQLYWHKDIKFIGIPLWLINFQVP